MTGPGQGGDGGGADRGQAVPPGFHPWEWVNRNQCSPLGHECLNCGATLGRRHLPNCTRAAGQREHDVAANAAARSAVDDQPNPDSRETPASRPSPDVIPTEGGERPVEHGEEG